MCQSNHQLATLKRVTRDAQDHYFRRSGRHRCDDCRLVDRHVRQVETCRSHAGHRDAGAGNPSTGAGDYLEAGTGTDALYGGPGSDTLQMPFTLIGAQPLDTLVGGAGAEDGGEERSEGEPFRRAKHGNTAT